MNAITKKLVIWYLGSPYVRSALAGLASFVVGYLATKGMPEEVQLQLTTAIIGVGVWLSGMIAERIKLSNDKDVQVLIGAKPDGVPLDESKAKAAQAGQAKKILAEVHETNIPKPTPERVKEVIKEKKKKNNAFKHTGGRRV